MLAGHIDQLTCSIEGRRRQRQGATPLGRRRLSFEQSLVCYVGSDNLTLRPHGHMREGCNMAGQGSRSDDLLAEGLHGGCRERFLDRGSDRRRAEGVGSIATYIWSQCLPLKAMLLHGCASSRLHFRPFLVGAEVSWSKVIEISSVVARNGWVEGHERRPRCRMRPGRMLPDYPFSY